MPPVTPGDEWDWGVFFARYQAMAIGFARGLVGDADLAAELWQESVRAILERVASGELRFADRGHARNYLFRALRNLAIDARRGRSLGVELAEDPVDPRAPAPDQAVGDAEWEALRDRLVQHAVDTLDMREREALRLRFEQGLGYKEMAVRLGRSISTVQARVEAGLRKVRQQIGNRLDPK